VRYATARRTPRPAVPGGDSWPAARSPLMETPDSARGSPLNPQARSGFLADHKRFRSPHERSRRVDGNLEKEPILRSDVVPSACATARPDFERMRAPPAGEHRDTSGCASELLSPDAAHRSQSWAHEALQLIATSPAPRTLAAPADHRRACSSGPRRSRQSSFDRAAVVGDTQWWKVSRAGARRQVDEGAPITGPTASWHRPAQPTRRHPRDADAPPEPLPNTTAGALLDAARSSRIDLAHARRCSNLAARPVSSARRDQHGARPCRAAVGAIDYRAFDRTHARARPRRSRRYSHKRVGPDGSTPRR